MPHYIQLLQGQIDAFAEASGRRDFNAIGREELAGFLRLSLDLNALIREAQRPWSTALQAVPLDELDVPRARAETEEFKRLHAAWLKATDSAHAALKGCQAAGAEIAGSACFREQRLLAKGFLMTDVDRTVQTEREMRAGIKYTLQEIRDELRSRVLAAG